MNHYKTARRAYREGDLHNAVRQFRLWLNDHPQDTTARYDLAATYFKLGELQSSERTMREALDIDDQCPAHRKSQNRFESSR